MSKATIISVEKSGGPKGKIEFQIDGKDKPWKVNDFSGKVHQVKAGDRVDIKVEKNQQGYWQITDLQLDTASSSNSSATTTNASQVATPVPQSTRQYYPEDPNKQKTIQRSVALKASVDFIVGMMAHGYIKKTASLDLLNGLVADQCAEWEQYLTLRKDYALPVTQEREPGEDG